MPADPTTEATPRFQVLSALAAHGKLQAGDIKGKTTLDDRQVGNALYSAKGAAHAERDAHGAWTITKKGRAWLTGGAKFAPATRAAKTSPASVKTSRRTPAREGKDLDPHEQQRAGVVEISAAGKPKNAPKNEAAAPGFRSAIFNDGSLYIAKNGVEIELDAEEHKQFLVFLDRLAEPLARAA